MLSTEKLASYYKKSNVETSQFIVTLISLSSIHIQVNDNEMILDPKFDSDDELFYIIMYYIGELSLKSGNSNIRALYLMSQLYPHKYNLIHAIKSMRGLVPFRQTFKPKEFGPLFDFKVKMIKENAKVLTCFMLVNEFEDEHPEYFLD
jgi:uncharacterized protein YegP (UPF0339 family)